VKILDARHVELLAEVHQAPVLDRNDRLRRMLQTLDGHVGIVDPANAAWITPGGHQRVRPAPRGEDANLAPFVQPARDPHDHRSDGAAEIGRAFPTVVLG
jgi:hypothetical protein